MLPKKTPKYLWILAMSIYMICAPMTTDAQMVQSDGIISCPAPQAMSFMRYGDTPVKLFTGTVSAEIPIYTYKDKDFEFPVSVSYSSNGYLPNHPTGPLGLGWFLNTGGYISREIKGAPDDAVELDSAETNLQPLFWMAKKGYYHFHALDHPQCNIAPSFNYFWGYTGFLISNRQDTMLNGANYYQYYETCSDIYTFKFGNHSGTFMLGPNGEIHVFNTNHPHGEYKIEFLALDEFGFTGMKITTGDGYTYTFGGTPELKNHSRPQSEPVSPDLYFMKFMSYKSNWPLTSIEAPNGRILKLLYDSSTEASAHYTSYNSAVSHYKPLPVLNDTIENYRFMQITQAETLSSSYEIIYDSRLIGINIDDRVQIDFEYGTKRQEQTVSLRDDQKELRNRGCLASVTVRRLDDNKQLKKATFSYTYSSPNGSPMQFLKHAYLSGEGYYSMTYYNEGDIFPKHGTQEYDLWGYYNLKSNSVSPNANAARFGMLHTITYPTGGYTRFEYEGHDYSYTVARRAISPEKQFMYPCSTTPMGGVRIRKITDYASETDSTYREFIYTANGRSTGIALCFPRYIIFREDDIPESKGGPGDFETGLPSEPAVRVLYTTSCRYSDAYVYLYCPDGTPIEYSQVKEKRSDGSSVIYRFSNAVNMPDLTPLISYADRNPEAFEPKYLREFNPVSRHIQRGKLIRKEIYNDQDRLVSAEDHVYDTTKVLKYISGLGVAKGCMYEQRTLVEDYPLRTLRLITYQGEDSVCIENRFGYNDLGQTIQTETDDSQGIVQTVKTRYVADIPTAERTMVENSMIEHNVLQNPLVIFEYIKKPGSSEKLVRGIRSQFGVFGYDSKLIKPICIEKTNLERPIDSVNFDAETHWKIIKTFDEYDNLGNVIQSTDKAGVTTAYIWGFNGLLPVAEAVNCDLSLVEMITPSVSMGGNSNLGGNLSTSQEYQLRSLPNTSVTTYEYDPHIGLIRKTDPSNHSLYYDYDEHGRLRTVSDSHKNITEQYDYHFKQ